MSDVQDLLIVKELITSKNHFNGGTPIVQQTHIGDPADPGAAYAQAEVVALNTAIKAILVRLENIGVVASA